MREVIKEFKNLWEEDERSASRGDTMGKMTNTDEKHDRDISWEVPDTRVVPIKNSVVMKVWDDMK